MTVSISFAISPQRIIVRETVGVLPVPERWLLSEEVFSVDKEDLLTRRV
jgi:hypothetical protein